MSNTPSSGALTLTLLAQTDTLTQDQSIQCINEDHTLIIAKSSSLTNSISLYEISSGKIVTNVMSLPESIDEMSCIIINEVSRYLIYLLVKSPKQALYRILFGSPIQQKVGLWQIIETGSILQIGYIPSRAQLVQVYESKLTIFNSTWEYQSVPYMSPGIKIVGSNPILIYTYEPCGFIESVNRQTQDYKFSSLSNSPQITCSDMLFDESDSIIGISVFNTTSDSYSGEYFFTKYLDLINYSQNYRFLMFSQFQSNATFIVDQQQLCYSSFQIKSSTISIQKQVCYSGQTNLANFQQIIVNRQQYFFNGTLLFHKSYNQSDNDPALYYPNQQLSDEDQPLFDLNSTVISTSADQILIFTDSKLYLSKPEIVETESIGPIIGAIAGVLVVIIIIGILLFRYFRGRRLQQSDQVIVSSSKDLRNNSEEVIAPIESFVPIDSNIPNQRIQDQCCICLQTGCNSVLPCQHYYHLKCIKRWLKSKYNRCPQCQRETKSQHVRMVRID